MLKIRLQRVGRKNDPSFRVIVTDSRKGPKTGNYIEMLGSYNPRQKTVSVNGERAKYWISMGAQVSGTVNNILINEKVLDGKKINVLGKKTPIVKEKKEEADKAEAVDESKVETAPADSEEKTEEAPKEEVKPASTDDKSGEEEPKEETPTEETPKEEDKKEAE